ncbi:MAG: 4-hydroxythreonine-4-phosphate dehydrogenase PdxA [Bacteroidota bacterium]
MKVTEKEIIPKVGITQGDINGVSYEVIIKALSDNRMLEICTPIVYGSSKVASYHRKLLNIGEFNLNLIRNADQATLKRANIINVFQEEAKIDIGESTLMAGALSLLSLEACMHDYEKGLINAIVTGPINKKNIQSKEFNFPGHTEYFARKFQSSNYLMLMCANKLRIGLITTHNALKDVPSLITSELILKKVEIMNQSLKRDFAVPRPKIAVLSVNPHSGDDGLIGDEEKNVIIPAINKAIEQNLLVFGPFPADGFFGSGNWRNFDGVIAMYHDQGLLPFKILADKEGVNFTAGLPLVRTSPAHGTAFDIAGKDKASPDSMRQAIYLAADIFKNRIEYDELLANTLK